MAEFLTKWSAAVFDDLSQGVREIKSLADPTAGEVRFGCHEAENAGLIPAVIDRLSQQFPRLVFTVKQAARSHRYMTIYASAASISFWGE